MFAVSVVCFQLGLIKKPQTNGSKNPPKHKKKPHHPTPNSSSELIGSQKESVRRVSLPLAPVAASPGALAGWKSVGLSVFHPGGQTYRQGTECNLLFQRKARCRKRSEIADPRQEGALPPPRQQTGARTGTRTSTPLPSHF